MARTFATRLSTPSLRSVERGLAALFVALLGTYALGTLVSGPITALRDAGVVAVHVAIPVAVALTLSLGGHAVVGWVSDDRTVPRRLEVATLGLIAISLSLTTVAPTESVGEVLFWIAAGGSLLIAGLVLGRR